MRMTLDIVSHGLTQEGLCVLEQSKGFSILGVPSASGTHFIHQTTHFNPFQQRVGFSIAGVHSVIGTHIIDQTAHFSNELFQTRLLELGFDFGLHIWNLILCFRVDQTNVIGLSLFCFTQSMRHVSVSRPNSCFAVCLLGTYHTCEVARAGAYCIGTGLGNARSK